MLSSVVDMQRILARSIRDRRLALGFTQAELAHRAGLGRQYVARLETLSANPTLQSIEALARVLDCSVIELLADSSRPSIASGLSPAEERLLKAIRGLSLARMQDIASIVTELVYLKVRSSPKT